MKLFGALYDRVLGWAAHRHAPAYLSGLSIAEASFFPIPPDVMLLPMAMARPKCWWWFATLATFFSALGGLLGYLIGWLLIDAVMPHLLAAGFGPAIEKAKAWFAEWGVWAIIVAGFSPIPYKVFTILAGALTMNPFWFFIASVVGRGGRFYLVAGLIAWAGPKIAPRVRHYIEWLGWGTVVVLVLAIVLWRLR